MEATLPYLDSCDLGQVVVCNGQVVGWSGQVVKVMVVGVGGVGDKGEGDGVIKVRGGGGRQ